MSDKPVDELAIRRKQALLAKGKGFLSCDANGCKRICELTPAGEAGHELALDWFVKATRSGVLVFCPMHSAGMPRGEGA